MKKTLTILFTIALVAVLSLTLVACANKNKNNGGNTTPAPSSEKGNTYTQSKFVPEWENEEAKNAMLTEMKLTEEQFMNFYNGTQLTVTFGNDDRVSVNAPGFGSTGYSKMNLFYSIDKDGVISFYETAEAKEAGTPFTGDGIFESKFVISADYTTISFIGEQPGVAKLVIVLTIK